MSAFSLEDVVPSAVRPTAGLPSGHMTGVAVPQDPRAGLRTAALAEALDVDTSPSRLASVDRARVSQVAQHLRAREDFHEFSPATWDDELFWNASDTPARRSQFFTIGNTINFRFWSCEAQGIRPASGYIDGQTFRGSMYMWRSLRRALERNDVPLLDAAFLAQLSKADFDFIFSDDTGTNPLAIADDERIANLRDLGSRLTTGWDGEFFNLVQATNGSLVEFARLSRSFRAFDDPVYKLTMVNAIVHSGSGTYSFHDEPLPAIDYHLLKQALRQAMIIPSADLGAKLSRGVLLEPEESIELRRTALLAFVQLADESRLSGEILDNKYWLNRSVCTDPAPACRKCPFVGACAQHIAFQLPLELTRYY